jgi:PTS system ascorbate-specific IIA component
MPVILIIAHAPLASALKAVAVHAYPDCALRLDALDVAPDMPVEAIEARARELLAARGDAEALVLTDVFGATPANVAQRLAESPGVRVIAGVNVPMLWRCLCYASEPLDALASRAVAGATQGVMQVASLRPQNQSLKPAAHDQDQRHHQQ